MPASGYELGMGQFVLPGLGVFVVSILILWGIGKLLSRPKRATPLQPRHDIDPMMYWDGQRWWRWDHGQWNPVEKDERVT